MFLGKMFPIPNIMQLCLKVVVFEVYCVTIHPIPRLSLAGEMQPERHCTLYTAMYTRPVFKKALCELKSAHSVCEFLRLMGISGKNSRSIRHLEVPDPASLILNGEFDGI